MGKSIPKLKMWVLNTGFLAEEDCQIVAVGGNALLACCWALLMREAGARNEEIYSNNPGCTVLLASQLGPGPLVNTSGCLFVPSLCMLLALPHYTYIHRVRPSSGVFQYVGSTTSMADRGGNTKSKIIWHWIRGPLQREPQPEPVT